MIDADTLVRTRLEDLQAEIEAGSRKLSTIAESAAEIRETLLAQHLGQAALAGTLMRRIGELQKSIAQQRERMRELRVAIRQTLPRRQHGGR